MSRRVPWGSNVQPRRRVRPVALVWRCECEGRPERRAYLVACPSCGARRDTSER